MKSEASIEIDRPIEEVFTLTMDHVAEWSIIVVEDTVIEEKPEGVGTTFRCITEEHGKRMEFQGVVTRHEPPRFSAALMTGKMFDIDVEYQFEELSPDRTRVTQRSDVTGKGFMKVFFALFGWMMNKANCDAAGNELGSLKSFCESHSGLTSN